MDKICGARLCFALLCFAGWCAVAIAWAPPEDAEPGNIDWSLVSTSDGHFFLGDDGYVYRMVEKALVATQSLIGSHACTMLGANLSHVHYQYDSPVGFATVDRVNAFWDAWFLWKDPQNTIQHRIGGTPTTRSNCYTYAMSQVNKGVYGYWLTTDAFNTALSHDMYYAGHIADAYSGVCLKDSSVIDYDGHASFISNVEEPPDDGCDPPSDCGAIRTIRWKWRESAIYQRSMDSNYTILADTGTFHFWIFLPGQHAETVRQNTDWGSYVYSTYGGHVWHKTK